MQSSTETGIFSLNEEQAVMEQSEPSLFVLLTGIGLNFFRFLKSIGISGGNNLVVLSSKDSYSFSEQQLRDARILVNLKKLNLIKHLDLFLSSLIHILPPETSFIGYFSERKHGSKVFSLVERIMNLLPFFYRPFRNSGRHSFNREQVMELLEKNGFRTIAMKEIRGKTYFLTRSVQIPA
jgi:hypothetical protein